MSDVYSYHTFLLPFGWKDKSKFHEKLRKGAWEKADWNDVKEKNDLKEALLHYAAYQYFNRPACRAIFGLDSDEKIVSNYLFQFKQRKDVTYIIEKTENVKDEKVEFKWILYLRGVRLKIFNTGNAVLIFELENKFHRSIEDVKKINEYGRRMIPPFLTPGDLSCSLCADRIRICVDGETLFSTNFTTAFSKQEDLMDISKIDSVSSMIANILFYDPSKKDSTKGREKFSDIYTILDDRMFVCCVVRDNCFINQMKGEANCRYSYLEDDAIGKQLYAVSFIDGEDSSCQNSAMLRDLLKKHIYGRWIDYGTIHAVTHQSMMCFTGECNPEQKVDFLKDAVVNPFLTQYIQIAILVLVQRTSFIEFASKASEVALGMKKNKPIGKLQISQLMHLQESYLKFQNQLLLFEVTPQEQGVEIYDMLKESLYIEHEKSMIEDQFRDLYQAASVNQSYLFSFYAAVFAILGCCIMVMQLNQESFELGIVKSLIIIVALCLICFLVVWLKFKRYRR